MADTSSLETQYNTLYAEIQQNSNISAMVFTTSMTATAALIGYAISSEIWGIFFAPFVILLPSLFLIASQLTSTIKNASYISVFIEPELGKVNYETDWYKIRKAGLVPHGPMGGYIFSVTGLYGLVGILCLGLPWLYLDLSYTPDVILCSVVSFIVIVLMLIAIKTLKSSFSLEFLEAYHQAWEKIKES